MDTLATESSCLIWRLSPIPVQIGKRFTLEFSHRPPFMLSFLLGSAGPAAFIPLFHVWCCSQRGPWRNKSWILHQVLPSKAVLSLSFKNWPQLFTVLSHLNNIVGNIVKWILVFLPVDVLCPRVFCFLVFLFS